MNGPPSNYAGVLTLTSVTATATSNVELWTKIKERDHNIESKTNVYNVFHTKNLHLVITSLTISGYT